ncbi:hypothetical protein [Sphingomonas endophytica]|uniref:Uncharacterized protein n=1 Tax=Sphingomonas endophytica TaxID=869719 RepID=A0A147I3V4_9SPHN|nr:hypothetical protein [Sphingomonas endophytica]KTT72829.1 hypothetical protein NS334_08295 [Sphingomonas endophytica]
MLFTTPTQYIALAIALVAGWLFGLASHPGGKKWKARYAAERDAHAATSKRVTELEREHDTATRRTAELERENETLRQVPAVTEERVVRDDRPLADRDDRIAARSAAAPAHPPRDRESFI